MMVKLFLMFTSLPCYYLLMKRPGDKLPSQSWVVACLSYRELHALKSLGHTFWPLSNVQVPECFVEIPVRILLNVLFRVFHFLKGLLMSQHLLS